MARQEGTLKLSSNLEPKMKAPLDARLVVPAKADLLTLEYPYPGMTVAVLEDGMSYKLDGENPAQESSWVEVGVGDLLDDVPAVGNRSSFLEEHVGDVQRFEGGMYYYLYKSYDDGLAIFNGDLTQYYWRVKYENGSEEFVELRNRRADTDNRFRYDLFNAFTDTPYSNGVIGALNYATFAVSRPNQSQTQWANGRIDVIGTYGTNYTEAQIGHPRAMSMTPYAKTTIKKMSDIVKADLFLQGIIEEKGSSWGIAKSGRLRFVFATQQQEISDLWVDISELGLSSAEDYVVQLTITGGGTMDWGASELFVWEKRTTQFGVTCRNMTSATKDYTIVDYTVIAKGFGGGSGSGGSGSGTGEVPTINEVLTKGYTTTKSIYFSEENGSDTNSIDSMGLSLSGTATEGLRQAQYSQHGIKVIDNLVGTITDIFSVDFDNKEVAMSDGIKSAFKTALDVDDAETAIATKQDKLVGGLKGQVPVKVSAADGDMEWADVEDAFANQKKYVIGDYVNAITNFTNGVSNTGVSLHPYESRLFKIFHAVEGTETETICYVDERHSQTSTTPYVYRFEDLDTYGRSYTMDVEYTTVPRPNPNPQGIPPVIQVPQWTCDDTTVTKIEIYNATVTELIRTLPTGGSAGQVLVKQSDIDGDAAWGDASGGGGTVDQTYDATSANAQSGTAVAEALAGAVYDDTALAARVQAVEDSIDALTENAPAALDTLKEIADWISADETGTQALVDRVAANETALGGHTVGASVPSDAVFTDTVYDDTGIAARIQAVEDLTDGMTKLTITMVDGNNVSHTYEIVGKEVTT